ncbi:MAG: zinc-finger domain-containing protein [Nitrosomonas sp.]
MNQHNHNNKSREVEITVDALPLHCPTPQTTLWNTHPRVYLPIEATGKALCPYCGTLYVLKGGAFEGHH